MPSDWEKVQLGDLAEVVGGGTPNRGESRYWGGAIPWATPTDITAQKSKYLRHTSESITHVGLAASAARLLPVGAVLFTSRATIGAKAIVDLPVATNQGFANLIPRRQDSEYLYYLVELLTPAIKRLGAGTTYPEVSKRDVRKVWCAIPRDVQERRVIVGLLAAIDDAIQHVAEALEAARTVKQAVLQRFFYDALGETAYADRPRKPLPSGWELVPMKRLLHGEPKNGLSPPASSQPPGVTTFSIGAIREGRVNLTNPDHLKYAQVSEAIASPFEIRRGDVLIVRGNANPHLVGKAGVVERVPFGCIYPDIAKRITFAPIERSPAVLPQYGVLAWNHPVVHNQVLRRAKTSNGTLKINNDDVKRVVLPVPPLEAQEGLADIAGALDAQAAALRDRGDALRQLRKALLEDLISGTVRIPVDVRGGRP